MGEVVIISEDGLEFVAQETESPQTERKMMSAGEAADGDGGGGGASVAAAASSSVVRWERFLPKMVLRVLLVEADDSTRQIITALLRKCSYRVAAVPDGLKAWEVLKGRPHNIDLILTEVELPSISGYALLTLIMEHDICKNIPVIMMSSNDSVSTVYKCMLRGAADFLVKPVRKNELRNLWQHVWRRQASSSGGIGPPDEGAAQPKVEATAENNATSNHSSGYMACVQRNREDIEKGTDAQSSCTKPEMETEGAEIDNAEGLSPSDRTKGPSNDMNIHTPEACSHETKTRQEHDNDAGGSQAGTSTDANATTQEEGQNHGNFCENVLVGQTSENNHILMNTSGEAIDLLGAFDNYLKGSGKTSASNASINKIDFSPMLDLSLRRSHHSGSVNQVADDMRGLNHSDASAFSRYVNKPLQLCDSTSPGTCNQQKDHESNSNTQLSNHNLDYNFDVYGPKISPRHATVHTHHPGQAEITPSNHQQRKISQPIPVRHARLETQSNGCYRVMPPMYHTQAGLSSQQSPSTVGHSEPTPPMSSFYPLNHNQGSSQNFSSLIDQRSNDATDHTKREQDQKLENADDRGHISSATDQSANSSFCNGNVNLHSFGSGSSGTFNVVSVVKGTSECGKEDGYLIQEGTSHRSSQREAALTKFRLKRKERCFDKKVRYESRKKLAEQRPRVKGQFVRQVPSDAQQGNSSAG